MMFKIECGLQDVQSAFTDRNVPGVLSKVTNNAAMSSDMAVPAHLGKEIEILASWLLTCRWWPSQSRWAL